MMSGVLDRGAGDGVFDVPWFLITSTAKLLGANNNHTLSVRHTRVRQRAPINLIKHFLGFIPYSSFCKYRLAFFKILNNC
jgi:hypothetical protein